MDEFPRLVTREREREREIGKDGIGSWDLKDGSEKGRRGRNREVV